MRVKQVGAGLILYTLGSRSLPAAELALLSLAEVLLGPLWVWLFLGETASLNTLIGGMVLLGSAEWFCLRQLWAMPFQVRDKSPSQSPPHENKR
jgi:hypothetical protein